MHLNALNVKLQGKEILVADMHPHITAFEVKLRLCEAQLANGQLEHFPRLAACVPDDLEPDTCVYGVPFSHLFTELQISAIEVHISPIQLQISPIQLEISAI